MINCYIEEHKQIAVDIEASGHADPKVCNGFTALVGAYISTVMELVGLYPESPSEFVQYKLSGPGYVEFIFDLDKYNEYMLLKGFNHFYIDHVMSMLEGASQMFIIGVSSMSESHPDEIKFTMVAVN